MGGNSQSGELTTAARATSVFALLMAAILSSVSALVAPSSAATTQMRMSGQRAGDLENEFTFDLHYFAASFLAFLSTPKRVGLVYLSMIQVQQFMIRME